MHINEMAKASHQTSKSKHWWDAKLIASNPQINSLHPGNRKTLQINPATLTADDIVVKLALVMTEAAEAIEAVREGKLVTYTNGRSGNTKPLGLPSEIADIMIRCGDLAEALNIDLEAEIKRKMAYNETRSPKHGGKAL